MISGRIAYMLSKTGFSGKLMFIFLISVCLYILIVPACFMLRSSEKEMKALNIKYRDMVLLSNDYKTFNEYVNIFEKRSSLTKVTGIGQAMDDISSSLGLRGKMKSIKVIGNTELKGTMNEEMAEIQLEKLNMNELTNFFYRTENAPMMLLIKKVKIKKSFDSPDVLDVTMTAALYTRK